MAKKKKQDEEVEAKAKPVPKVGVSLGAMLKGVTLEKSVPKQKGPKVMPKAPPPAPAPAPHAPPKLEAPLAPVARPSDSLRGGERSIYFEAMAGVRRIDTGPKVRAGRAVASPPPRSDPAERQRDEEARARLRALVGGGTKFDLREDDDYVEGSAQGTPETVMKQLLRATPGPELPKLDLHGAKEHEVEARVSRFVRGEQKKGQKRILVVHGKGLHSNPTGPQGRSILGRATVVALTQGGAAPLVRAFVSAPSSLGGTGALLVELK